MNPEPSQPSDFPHWRAPTKRGDPDHLVIHGRAACGHNPKRGWQKYGKHKRRQCGRCILAGQKLLTRADADKRVKQTRRMRLILLAAVLFSAAGAAVLSLWLGGVI